MGSPIFCFWRSWGTRETNGFWARSGGLQRDSEGLRGIQGTKGTQDFYGFLGSAHGATRTRYLKLVCLRLFFPSLSWSSWRVWVCLIVE